MSEGDMPGLRAGFDQIRNAGSERPPLIDADPETTVKRLTAAAFQLNVDVVTEFGGKLGRERIPGGTESAIGVAFQGFGGQDVYPDPFDKAAVIMRGIAGGHTLVDGNKRTGFLTSALYLDHAGYPLPEELPDEVYQFCLDVSSGQLREVTEIANKLREFWGVELPDQS